MKKRTADEALTEDVAAAADPTSSSSMPNKRFFRSRAHCNPLSHNDGFAYPTTPEQAIWSVHYPNIPEANRIVKFVDVGMGFGGLTIALAQLFPDKLVLGMEIRAKVCEYVRLKINAMRIEQPGQYLYTSKQSHPS